MAITDNKRNIFDNNCLNLCYLRNKLFDFGLPIQDLISAWDNPLR